LTVKSRRAASSSWLPKTLSRSSMPSSAVTRVVVLVVLGLGRGGAEGGDLDECLAAVDMHDLEAPADDARARRNRARTSSGVASVAISKSLGSRPSSRSRTAPPTMKAA
jgi:hypothetical protein